MIGAHLHHYLKHYFAFHPTKEMKELFVSGAIRNFAVGAIGIFEPIYLYTLGFSIRNILLFYLAVSVGYFFVLPLSGKICRKHGYEHTILFSSPFLIIYFLTFFAIKFHPVFIGAAIVSLIIQKALYWSSFHANFATWAQSDEEGKEISNRTALNALAAAFAPALGGLVIAAWGFGPLFIMVAVLILLSNVPLLRTPEHYHPREFSYQGAFRRLFVRENRRKIFSYLGFGEELFTLILWPIFIVLVVPSLFSLGAIIALSRLVNVFVTLYVGRLTDEGDKNTVLRSGVAYMCLSWLVRPLITGGLGVFLIDSFYRVSRNMTMVPFLSLTYDDARRKGVMESTLLFLMGLTLGKIVAILVALGSLWLFPLNPWVAIFVAGAVFTLFFSLMKEKK